MKKEIENALDKISDFKLQIKELVRLCPGAYMNVMKHDMKFGFIEKLRSFNDFLKDSKYTDQTRVYWILNDFEDFPKCELCGQPLINANVRNIHVGYGKILACCKKHLRQLIYKKACESNIKKYGYANPFQFSKDKIAKTNTERYGCSCVLQNPEIKKRIEEDNLKKYGCSAYQSTDDFKKRLKEISMQKYGVSCFLQSEEAKEKTKLTNLAKYGVEDYRQSEEIRKKMNVRLREKYGDDYRRIVWGGRGNIGQNRRAYSFMANCEIAKPCFSEDDYVRYRKENITEFEYECTNCGRHYYSDWDNGMPRKKCPYCQFNGGISGIENEILMFVSSIYDGKIRTNDRSLIAPLEVDEYIEGKKLAIELDGLYWHNDDVKPDYRYHLNKTELCEKQGVRLIHIFDSEWKQKQDIVKSRLKNFLGVYDKTVYARKCGIKIVGKNESRNFQDVNHIQGPVNATINLGLYFDNELISLMTFGKCRFDKIHEWEMIRFCNRLGYHVPGAASKLLKYFEKNYQPKSLVSYADRRWSNGNLYTALGFVFVHNSNPNYWYFKQNSLILESRVRYQKHKLPKLLEHFDPSKTEVENMKANGYFRIFDCGNMVFEKTY